MSRRFSQVNVFAGGLGGNPVAVVHDADGLSDAEMAAFAKWTNLSETTFLLAPTDPGADYRVRIFTTSEELPFAGHPTIGSAHAWLEAGGQSASAHQVVQQCAAGLVPIRRGERLAFAAPPLIRSGPVSEVDLDRVTQALRVERRDILDASWLDNGPGWLGVWLRDAALVLALQPDPGAFADLDLGVAGPYPPGGEVAIEVRAFFPGMGMVEDPVTGSLNAGFGQWLAGSRLPTSYVASQGTVLGRAGRVHVDRDGDQVWVGGDAATVITGSVEW